MTHAGIECFLAICRHKTGSAAAQALYITQPSLSARLKLLEQELGSPLFYRHKGSREMTLTATGKAFYALALQYEEVITKMQQLRITQDNSLRVSSFNSLGTYLLPAVYARFLQAHPQIGLDIQDKEFTAATRSLRDGETDLAFTSGKTTDSHLVQTPLFSEPMVLICGKQTHFTEPVTLTQLSSQDEVYIEWSSSFSRWHQQTMGSQQAHLRISIMAHLRQFLEREHCWAIVPITVAKGLAEEGSIQILNTAFPLPRRQVSCLRPADSKNAAADAFLDCLRQVLSTYSEIEILF